MNVSNGNFQRILLNAPQLPQGLYAMDQPGAITGRDPDIAIRFQQIPFLLMNQQGIYLSVVTDTLLVFSITGSV